MNKENKGLSYCHILNLIFVVAKIWGIINWSWWIIFIPIFVLIFFNVLQSWAESAAKKAKEQKEFFENLGEKH
jgi:hypothetical protein